MQETRVWSVMKETPNLCPMSSIYKVDGWKPSSPNPFYKADGRHACLSCPICSTPSNQPSRRCGTSSMLQSRQACLSCPCPVCSTPRNQPSMRRGAPSLCLMSTAMGSSTRRTFRLCWRGSASHRTPQCVVP